MLSVKYIWSILPLLNIDDGLTVGGVPSVTIKDWHRQTIILKKLISKKKNGK